MFNVRQGDFAPGFRVGHNDDELGFNIAKPYSSDEPTRSPAPKFDLAANP